MCGIVGGWQFANGKFRVTESYIVSMRDAMRHRGPDGAGVWIAPDGDVGLGHRRLSIIDLSEVASQPMSNEEGDLWVVFNGEIYNHTAIRAELQQCGHHRWKTDHSDTEVILHAFEEWGIDCLHRFRGMFAIALWDGRSKELWLVRDRIGIKPLYYSLHHGRIVFASEIKALLLDPEQERRMDEEALFHFLSFMTVPSPDTLFSGIHKIPGGSWLRVKADGQIEQRRYWDVWDHAKDLRGMDEDDVAQALLHELREAVQLRKVSDVPVGIFLSGGLDSSLNAALFSQGDKRPVKTFSIGYRDGYESYQSELSFAREMASRVGARYHEQILEIDDLISFLPDLIHHQDEPIADPVCIPLYYVSKLARDNNVIVAQVGEGSDELFWGYPFWKKMLQLQRWNDSIPLTSLKRLALSTLGFSSHQRAGLAYEFLRRGAHAEPVFWGGTYLFTEYQKQHLLSARLRQQFRYHTSFDVIQPIYDRFREKAWEPSHLNWMSYIDLNLRLPELLLMRVDKMSMAVSLEARVPFLDHKFVALAMSIPERVKTRNGTLKYILKKAARNQIPDHLIDRKKQGFGIPLFDWFQGRLGSLINTEVEQFCKETDFFDKDAVMKTIRSSRGDQGWVLLNLALWWKHFIKGE
jgi:asparagine synthase (glutamine-hydrolysing)